MAFYRGRKKLTDEATSRSVIGSSGVDFARQLAERNAEGAPAKKFRSSAAPKGSKLPSGYRDRTQDRVSDQEDDKATRIQALEEMVKLGQMDRAAFEKVRDEILGGDIKNTHLVKGLDYKLLERVKRGEDVLNVTMSKAKAEHAAPTREDDVDEELDRIEAIEVAPVVKDTVQKKGQMAPPGSTTAAGKKRSRDEILAELKASRKAAAAQKAATQPQLGPKFRRLGEKRETSRIEIDGRGREILITVDEEGRVKRKVKQVQAGTEGGNDKSKNKLLMPDKDAVPLGMDVSFLPSNGIQEAAEDTGDIFEDAGSDYDPLAGIGDEDDSEDDVDAVQGVRKDPSTSKSDNNGSSTTSITDIQPRHLNGSMQEEAKNMPPPPLPSTQSSATRNYFGTPGAVSAEDSSTALGPAPSTPLADPTILAALRKASALTPLAQTHQAEGSDEQEAAEAARRLARRQMLLSNQDRDAEDLDMGFGSSRFEDEEDTEEKRVKLSKWGGGYDDEDERGGGGGGGAKKRKRGPKKRKGDGNNAADVLRVLERRKAEAG